MPFDPLLASVAQRRGLRDYLQGLLLPRGRNKTLTALADSEPITGASTARSSGCSGSCRSRPGTTRPPTSSGSDCSAPTRRPRPMGRGALVIDDTGDRKDGSATAHVAASTWGRSARPTTAIVAVTSLWADGRCYWPLHAVPYTPASRLPA